MPYLLRVDDCGWTPDKEPDAGLAYFRKWRDTFGIAGLPAVYGFIPECTGDAEVAWLRANLSPVEELAVHGWDHAKGAVVTPEQMREAQSRFHCRAYIPPFNEYSRETIRDWGGGFFFGGFPEDNTFGNAPKVIEGAVHLPAFRPLYDRAHVLTPKLKDYRDTFKVVTLHVTWDAKTLNALPELLTEIRDDLIPLDGCLKWITQCC